MIRWQLLRYAIVGLSMNAALYGAYLLLTHASLSSRVAMTITYGSGVLIGFIANRKFTFRYRGTHGGALLRYIGCYAIGYAVNFVALWLLVDRAGMRHEFVQGGVTLALPALLFALQRYWVFPTRRFDGPSFLARPLS